MGGELHQKSAMPLFSMVLCTSQDQTSRNDKCQMHEASPNKEYKIFIKNENKEKIKNKIIYKGSLFEFLHLD